MFSFSGILLSFADIFIIGWSVVINFTVVVFLHNITLNSPIIIELDKLVASINEDIPQIFSKSFEFSNKASLYFFVLKSCISKERNKLIKIIGESKKLDFLLESNLNIFFHQFLSNSIMMIGEFKVILCKNTTTVKFITTDHPIINIFAKLNKIPEKGKHTFYYPVSPNLAILVGKTDNIGKKNCKDLTEKEVETYNYMMFKRAHEQIYAESKETLENLQKFKEKLNKQPY